MMNLPFGMRSKMSVKPVFGLESSMPQKGFLRLVHFMGMTLSGCFRLPLWYAVFDESLA